MTILGITQRFRELGRIRCGERVDIGGGKSRPGKLEKFRLTSSNASIMNSVAEIYGGEVSDWEAPTGNQFQVYVDKDSLDILIPPIPSAISQAWEMWGRGKGILRRCDGEFEQTKDIACICLTEIDGKDGVQRKCKPTTRLNVILPQIEGLGIWRLETGSFNAAAELPPVVELLRNAAVQMQRPVKAMLRLEQRQRKSGEGTRNFAVPVVDVGETLESIMLTPGVLAGPSMVELGAAPVHPDRPELPALPEPLAVQEEPIKIAPPAVQSPPQKALEPAGHTDTPEKKRQAPSEAPDAPVEQPVAADQQGSLVQAVQELDLKMDQAQWFAMMSRRAGYHDDLRHSLLDTVSEGRVQSAKDATTEELQLAIDEMVVAMKGDVVNSLKTRFGKDKSSAAAMKWLRAQADSKLDATTEAWGFDEWATAREVAAGVPV